MNIEQRARAAADEIRSANAAIIARHMHAVVREATAALREQLAEAGKREAGLREALDADALATKLLAVGDDYRGKCERIQFMVGPYGHELNGGGFCLPALSSWFDDRFREALAQPAVAAVVDADEAAQLREQLAAAERERDRLERSITEATRSKHGASGMCCALREQEQRRAEAAEQRFETLRSAVCEPGPCAHVGPTGSMLELVRCVAKSGSCGSCSGWAKAVLPAIEAAVAATRPE